MFMWIRQAPPKIIGGERYIILKDNCLGEIKVPRKINLDVYACFIYTVIEEYRKRNRNVTPNLIRCFKYMRAKWSIDPESIIQYFETYPDKLSKTSQITTVYVPLMRKCILPRLKGKK